MTLIFSDDDHPVVAPGSFMNEPGLSLSHESHSVNGERNFISEKALTVL